MYSAGAAMALSGNNGSGGDNITMSCLSKCTNFVTSLADTTTLPTVGYANTLYQAKLATPQFPYSFPSFGASGSALTN